MNIDLLKCITHAKSQEYIDTIFTQGCIPLNTKPIRITSRTATLIDHLYYNRYDKNTHSGIFVSDFTDHFGIISPIKHCTTNLRLNLCATELLNSADS
jgi:hypothetical protein